MRILAKVYAFVVQSAHGSRCQSVVNCSIEKGIRYFPNLFTEQYCSVLGLFFRDNIFAMIKVFEVWSPNRAGTTLTLNASSYGDLASFQLASTDVSFAKGEGLPGAVWAAKAPVIFPDLGDPALFLRHEAAIAAGLKTGLGIPLLDHGEVRAVVVLLCADGVMELWQPSADGSCLALHTGAYHGWESFGAASQGLTFAPGEGLPGILWSTQTPIIFADLEGESRFIRRQVAKAAGLTAALGIPIFDQGNFIAAIVLLSADAMPLSRIFEIWSPDTQDIGHKLSQRYESAAYTSAETNILSAPLDGESSRPVWPNKMTAILRALVDPMAFMDMEMAAVAGLSAGLTIPVLADDEIKATIVILN